jgi:hypothetical protein
VHPMDDGLDSVRVALDSCGESRAAVLSLKGVNAACAAGVAALLRDRSVLPASVHACAPV